MSTKKCNSCGYVGNPIHDEYSSLILDLFMWVGAFGIAAITGIIFFAIIGPAFSIWHMISFRSHRCPKCGDWEMHRTKNVTDHPQPHS